MSSAAGDWRQDGQGGHVGQVFAFFLGSRGHDGWWHTVSRTRFAGGRLDSEGRVCYTVTVFFGEKGGCVHFSRSMSFRLLCRIFAEKGSGSRKRVRWVWAPETPG